MEAFSQSCKRIVEKETDVSRFDYLEKRAILRATLGI
jgi:hypothetical protein